MQARPKKTAEESAGNSKNFRIPQPILEDLGVEAKEEHTTVADHVRTILLRHTRTWRKKKGLPPR
jgi:hypothetical protein